MRLFADKELKQELLTLDLGIVLAGDSKRYEYFLANDTDAEVVDIKLAIAHDDVKILKAPSELIANEVGMVLIEWSPSITIKKGLKTEVTITGAEIYS